ncbi:hypothetical protein H0E87_019997 [Populus deltoides]|uniref:Uncharacterized protein n=1 Tax=Populus deltoides TaxID=3696 RepID=A0A8T2XXG4_POPDE|nr:hypothetical protein H0E87_019997 [Populus deltoides]
MLLTPQAKFLVSILSSTNLVIPHEAYPLVLRTLYIRVRKSLRPSSALIDSAVVSLSHLLAIEFGSKKSPEFLSESVLLLGAFSFVLSVSESSKTVCLELLCRLLDDEYRLVSPFGRVIPDVLAGIGYALCSSVVVHHVRILNALLGIWGKEDGLTILHLAEWVISAGVLRASNRSPPSGQGLLILSTLRVSAENRIVCGTSVTLKEEGATSGVFCNRHISEDEEDNAIVENMVRRFCQELYSGHRQVAFLLHGKADVLLEDIYKIAEPVFLTVVVFALAATKQKLNSKFSTESQVEISILIPVSFSCIIEHLLIAV